MENEKDGKRTFLLFYVFLGFFLDDEDSFSFRLYSVQKDNKMKEEELQKVTEITESEKITEILKARLRVRRACLIKYFALLCFLFETV